MAAAIRDGPDPAESMSRTVPSCWRVERRLAAPVGSLPALGVLDAGPLRFLGGLGLGLGTRGHEGDQRVTDGLLHGLRGGAVECEGC